MRCWHKVAAVAQVFIVRVLAPWIRSATGGDHHQTTPEEARRRPPEAEAQPQEGPQPAASRDETEVGTRR